MEMAALAVALARAISEYSLRAAEVRTRPPGRPAPRDTCARVAQLVNQAHVFAAPIPLRSKICAVFLYPFHMLASRAIVGHRGIHCATLYCVLVRADKGVNNYNAYIHAAAPLRVQLRKLEFVRWPNIAAIRTALVLFRHILCDSRKKGRWRFTVFVFLLAPPGRTLASRASLGHPPRLLWVSLAPFGPPETGGGPRLVPRRARTRHLPLHGPRGANESERQNSARDLAGRA